MSYLMILHEITFYALYIAIAITAFVIIERLIFFSTTVKKTRALDASLKTTNTPDAALLVDHSVPVEVARTVLDRMPLVRTRHDLEDLSQEVYIEAKGKLAQHLWLLDTIVTAAPLLGLLGTIFGIIETFTTLASSGISDPKGVSAGIGTALFATALGIATALFGLLFLNYFNERLERAGEQIKVLILKLITGRSPQN